MEILQPRTFNLDTNNNFESIINLQTETGYPELPNSNEVRFVNGCLSPGTTLCVDKERKRASCKTPSSSLLVWGCGEFGQHGHDHSNDVTLDNSLEEVRNGRSLLLDGQSPVVVASGSSHTLVLTDNDHAALFSGGNGTSGQLGNGSAETSHKPVPVSFNADTPISGMACGARHSFFWTRNGECYSFGNNFNAQLGYNFSKADFKENQLEPVLMEFFPGLRVTNVACGARHTLFLMTTGQVMAVGCNQQGQIGNSSTEDVVIPIKLEDLNNISHIACGNSHSLAADDAGLLYAWGYGKAFGTKTRHVVSPKVFNKNCDSPVRSLAGGDSHSMALYQNGILYTWGNNYEGQLGLGPSLKYQSEPEPIPSEMLPRPVIQMSCGETTCAAVTGEGKLYMWGKNAGLIQSKKSSQHFQFEPHQIQVENKFVMQVSCGAWHVATVTENIHEANIKIEDEGLTNDILLDVEAEIVPTQHLPNTTDCEDRVKMPDNSATNIQTICDNLIKDEQCIHRHIIMDHVLDKNTDSDEAKIDKASCLNAQPEMITSIGNPTIATNATAMPTNVTAVNIGGDSDVIIPTTMNMTQQDKPTAKTCVGPVAAQVEKCADVKTKCEKQNSIRSNTKKKCSSKLTETIPRTSSEIAASKVTNLDHNTVYCNTGRSTPSKNYTNIEPRNNMNNESLSMRNTKNISQTKKDMDSPVICGNEPKQQIRIVRQSSMPVVSQMFDNVPARPQTVPVINLDFQSSPPNKVYAARQAQVMRKPSLQSFRNVWKSSRVFREQQSKKMLKQSQKFQPDADFNEDRSAAHKLPNSPKRAREINKWTQFKDQKATGNLHQSTARHICLKHSGEILPSICSCGDNIILTKEAKPDNNRFIERYKLDLSG